MAKSVAAKSEIEKIVVDFIHAAYGERMDVDAMTAMISDDFVWQLHVPLSPVVVGRDARAPAGRARGSKAIVSNDDTVVVERVDINAMNGVEVSFNVVAIFEVRDGRSPLARILRPRGASSASIPGHVRSTESVSNQRRQGNSADALARSLALGSVETGVGARV